VRLAVAAALIIGSAIFYFAYWLSMFNKQDNRSYIYMSEVASKYYLFGLGALLSLNFMQAGIFQTVMIYITMVTLFGVIAASMMHESVDDRQRSLAYLVFYSALFVWYMGIVIDFYVSYSQ
jgi:hypothetical protein